MDPPEDDERADLESAGQPACFRLKVRAGIELIPHDLDRRQQLRRNPAAPALSSASVGIVVACAFDTPDSPSHRWAISWANVNIWATFVSAPLTKTRGASASESTKPRNSSGSNLRWVLLSTTPLTITRTPRSSALSMNWRRASLHVASPRRCSTSKPRASRRRAPANETSSRSVQAPDELQRRFPRSASLISVPILALLTQVERVQQIRRRPANLHVSDGTEITYRKFFGGRFL